MDCRYIFSSFWEFILSAYPQPKNLLSVPVLRYFKCMIFYFSGPNNPLFSVIFGLCMTLQCCLFYFSSHVLFVSAFPGILMTVRCWVSGGYPGVQIFFMHKHTFNIVILWHGQYWQYKKKNLMHVKQVFGVPVYFMSRENNTAQKSSYCVKIHLHVFSTTFICCWLSFPGANGTLIYHCGYASLSKSGGWHCQWHGLLGADRISRVFLTGVVERLASASAVQTVGACRYLCIVLG